MLKTPECLDSVSIGLFAEGRLSNEEKQRAEEHLLACLYCIKQLNDMREMLYYERHPTGISQKVVERLEGRYPEQRIEAMNKGSLSASPLAFQPTWK